MMKQKQWRLQNNSSVHVKMLTNSFTVLIQLFNHLQINHHVSQLYMQRTRLKLRKDAHYRSETPIVQPPPHNGSKCMDTNVSTYSDINMNNVHLS